MMALDDLKAIGQGRWTAHVMALLLERDGARFAEFVGALGISRDSLVHTLDHAIQCGWVVHNPGYGHPLRPDYVLTEPGQAMAALCVRLLAARERLGVAPEVMSRWSLPVLGRLRGDWARFSDLRAELAPVTARALSLTLKQLMGGRMIDRRVEEGFPPSSRYGLAPLGLTFLGQVFPS